MSSFGDVGEKLAGWPMNLVPAASNDTGCQAKLIAANKLLCSTTLKQPRAGGGPRPALTPGGYQSRHFDQAATGLEGNKAGKPDGTGTPWTAADLKSGALYITVY